MNLKATRRIGMLTGQRRNSMLRNVEPSVLMCCYYPPKK